MNQFKLEKKNVLYTVVLSFVIVGKQCFEEKVVRSERKELQKSWLHSVIFWMLSGNSATSLHRLPEELEDVSEKKEVLANLFAAFMNYSWINGEKLMNGSLLIVVL